MSTQSMKLLLAVEDDNLRRSLAKELQQKEREVHKVTCCENAWDELESTHFDVLVLELSSSGLDLLKRIRHEAIDVEVIALSRCCTKEIFREAMRLGVCDFLTKRCSPSQLEHRIQLAYQLGRLRRENQQLKGIIFRSRGDPDLIWNSSGLNDVIWN
ncbi:MAG: response regulator [Pirellulaceae bacterium]|nr:response regulator [Pirellulaceae bacterium]